MRFLLHYKRRERTIDSADFPPLSPLNKVLKAKIKSIAKTIDFILVHLEGLEPAAH